MELLVVVGLLIAVLAIALPFTFSMLDERELAASEENIAAELMKARVRAQESGKPVEVLAVEGAPWRIAMRYFDAGKRAQAERRRGAVDARGRAEIGAPQMPREFDRVRDSWWEESELNSSVRLTAADTVDDDARGDGAATKGSGGSLRVAVFLPDGSILFAATLLLMHDNGLRSRVSVDPWTGQPAIERGVAAANDHAPPCPDDASGDNDAASRRELSDEWKDQFKSDDVDHGERGSGH